MSRQREWLVRAAVELGLQVRTDHVLRLPSGREVTAEAYFPDLGTEVGWAVFDAALPKEVELELVEQAYPASYFSAPGLDESFDLESYAEMFAEWGWSGAPALKPAWMEEFEDDSGWPGE